MISDHRDTPCFRTHACISFKTFIAASGRANDAVPTCTACAPACIIAIASLPLAIPPTPTMGMCGIALRTSNTARNATGNIARPDTPPPPFPKTGCAVSVFNKMPSKVLVRVSDSAPASTTLSAIAMSRSVLGLNFAHSGVPAAAQAAMTFALISASWAMIPPRPSKLGQDKFTSSAVMRCATGASISAA